MLFYAFDSRSRFRTKLAWRIVTVCIGLYGAVSVFIGGIALSATSAALGIGLFVALTLLALPLGLGYVFPWMLWVMLHVRYFRLLRWFREELQGADEVMLGEEGATVRYDNQANCLVVTAPDEHMRDMATVYHLEDAGFSVVYSPTNARRLDASDGQHVIAIDGGHGLGWESLGDIDDALLRLRALRTKK